MARFIMLRFLSCSLLSLSVSLSAATAAGSSTEESCEEEVILSPRTLRNEPIHNLQTQAETNQPNKSRPNKGIDIKTIAEEDPIWDDFLARLDININQVAYSQETALGETETIIGYKRQKPKILNSKELVTMILSTYILDAVIHRVENGFFEVEDDEYIQKDMYLAPLDLVRKHLLLHPRNLESKTPTVIKMEEDEKSDALEHNSVTELVYSLEYDSEKNPRNLERKTPTVIKMEEDKKRYAFEDDDVMELVYSLEYDSEEQPIGDNLEKARTLNDTLAAQGNLFAFQEKIHGHELGKDYKFKDDSQESKNFIEMYVVQGHHTAISYKLKGLQFGWYGYPADRLQHKSSIERYALHGDPEAVIRLVYGRITGCFGFDTDLYFFRNYLDLLCEITEGNHLKDRLTGMIQAIHKNTEREFGYERDLQEFFKAL